MNITFCSNKTKTEYYLIPIRSNYTLIRRNTASFYHIHPVYHIMFVTAGEGFLETDHATYSLREKDIFVVHPNEKHILTSAHPEGLTYITFNFYLLDVTKSHGVNIYDQIEHGIHENTMATVAETLRLDELFDLDITDIFISYNHLLWDRIISYILSFLDKIEKININSINSFRKGYNFDRKYWFNLFSKLFWDFYILLSSAEKESIFNSKGNDLSEQIIRFLEYNLHEKFSLSKLAEHLNYNPIYLCSYFKKNSGLTINQYFNKLKIQKSCEYLRSTNKSLTEIASLLNYSSSNHFSRSFKQEKSICPKDYRRHLEK